MSGVIAAGGGGGAGGGAPADAEYLVGAADGDLPAARVVTDTATVAWDHGTAAQTKANVVAGSIGATQLALPKFTAVLVLASDVSTETVIGAHTDLVDVTGMSFSYEANSVYMIDFIGSIQSASAATGCGLGWNTSTTVTQVLLGFVHQLANTGTLSGGSSIGDDVAAGVSSGRPLADTDVPVFGNSILRSNGNAGTAQLRLRSELDAIVTIKAGFTMRIMKIA